jgi:hypothetical protein
MIANTVEVELSYFQTEINRSIFYTQAQRAKLRRSILIFADDLWVNEQVVPTKLHNWIDYLNGV